MKHETVLYCACTVQYSPDSGTGMGHDTQAVQTRVQDFLEHNIVVLKMSVPDISSKDYFYQV